MTRYLVTLMTRYLVTLMMPDPRLCAPSALLDQGPALVFRLNDNGQGPELLRQVFLERGWSEFDEDRQVGGVVACSIFIDDDGGCGRSRSGSGWIHCAPYEDISQRANGGG